MKKRLFGLVAMMLAAMIFVLAFPVQVKAESYFLGGMKAGTPIKAGDSVYYSSCGGVIIHVDGERVPEGKVAFDKDLFFYKHTCKNGVNHFYLVSKMPAESTTSAIKISPEEKAIMEYNDAWDKLQKEYADETQLPVEPFMTEQAIASVPETVKNNSTAIANLTPLKTVPGVMALINKAQKVTAGDNVAIYTEKPMTFSKEGFEAISNQNKTVVYAFKIDGVLYQITIPAGAKVDFGDNTYVGPLWIGAQLGSTAILE